MTKIKKLLKVIKWITVSPFKWLWGATPKTMRGISFLFNLLVLDYLIITMLFIPYSEAHLKAVSEPVVKTISMVEVREVEKPEQEKVYAYNERVPEDLIIDEMNVLADRFNINQNKWEKVLRCEATNPNDGKLDNLICNPLSTACGLGQYLIRTWYETESWKQYRCARTDYKCTLWEMGLDIKNGEQWRWQECLDITGISF